MNVVTDSAVKMTPEEFRLIRDFIHEKSGMFFSDSKMYLIENRLQKRLAELNIHSVQDYFYHVKYDVSLKEFNTLMELVTTNETSFYRNEPQLACFAEEVLTRVIEERGALKGTKQLRIWSAGCSTGEEPYTLAILALEALRGRTDWKIEIIGNDISEDVLKRARKGVYSGITLRNVPQEILRRYFTKEGDNYHVRPEVAALTKFSRMNLNEPRQVSMMKGFDMVFCRNVMIYFSEDVRKQLVRGFFNALNPGGYFFIGHSETLHGISKAFKLVYFKNALVYHKETVKDEGKWGGAARQPATAATAAAATTQGASRAQELLNKIKPIMVKK